MCFIVLSIFLRIAYYHSPYDFNNRYLVPGVAIKGGPSKDAGCFAYQLQGMIHFFTQGTQDEVASLRGSIYKEFGHMRNQDGEFLHRYMVGPAPFLHSLGYESMDGAGPTMYL